MGTIYNIRGGTYYIMSDGSKNQIIYEDDMWAIDLRPRNNHHEGEPDVKVWVSMMGQEVAQYSSKFRGYGHYRDHEELIPPAISGAAKLAWSKLLESAGSDADITEAANLIFNMLVKANYGALVTERKRVPNYYDNKYHYENIHEKRMVEVGKLF
jgi:hypothetical protein